MVCTYCLLLKNKKNFVLFIFCYLYCFYVCIFVERSLVRSSHIVDSVVRSEETYEKSCKGEASQLSLW